MDSPSGKKLLACMTEPCMKCGHCPDWDSHREGNTTIYTTYCRYSIAFPVVHSLNGYVHYWHRIPHDRGRQRGRLCECRNRKSNSK